MNDVSFEQFVKERLYLQNVSPRTIEWYEQSFKWLDTPTPDDAALSNSSSGCGRAVLKQAPATAAYER
jgi:hypothetical protein